MDIPKRRRGGERYTVDENGCWVWRDARYLDGYAAVRIGGRTLRAHRVYWMNAHGDVPRGYDLHHTCCNRGCVNPDHLKLVDHVEHGHSHAIKKLDADKVREIRSGYRGGQSMRSYCLAVASECGMSLEGIEAVMYWRNWKHVV